MATKKKAPAAAPEPEGKPYIVFQGREYEVPDYKNVTFRENQLVKKVTGLRVGELQEAFETNDSDAILALFLIAKVRADGEADIEALLDQPVLDFELILKYPDGEASPTEAPAAGAEGEAAVEEPEAEEETAEAA